MPAKKQVEAGTKEEKSMPMQLRDLARKRIFFAQCGLVLFTFALLLLGYYFERKEVSAVPRIGSFWFAFFVGAIGASVAIVARMRRSDDLVLEIARSHYSILLPLMYGAMMASVSYILFMSGVVSGDGGDGFLTSNLFPNFGSPQEGVEPSISAFIDLRPASLKDAGKLLVWSFISGYSERFVVGLLAQMESRRGAANEEPTKDSKAKA